MIEISPVVSIPAPISPMIGRELELAQLIELVGSHARLITITGIGGIGKTRLATQVALEMEPFFKNGALLVRLAEVRDASQIAEKIGDVLGHTIAAGDTATVATALEPAPRLLVLDNLEQIPDASEFLSELLSLHENITLLVTSQVPLRIEGEQVYRLGPMLTPTDDEPLPLNDFPSVQLFLQRAHAADVENSLREEDLPIVAEICAALEGIPLAIELAAARLIALPPAALLERLGNRFDVLGGGSPHVDPRLRTMRNAVAWSYDLLSPGEQRIFRYLGVYAGNISVEAVEHTLATLEMSATPWEVIDAFLSRSLLQKTQGGKTPGYRMLQTLRDFAHEQLELEGEQFEAHLAHAGYVVNLAELAENRIRGVEQQHWFGVLKTESDNFRAATDWAATHRPEYVFRVIAAIWRYLVNSGGAERYSTLGSTLSTSDVPDEVLARAYLGIGALFSTTYREPERARELLQHAKEIAERLGDERTLGRVENTLGSIERNLGNNDASLSHFQAAARHAKSASNVHDLAAAMGNIALEAYSRNDIPLARERMIEMLPVAEETQDQALLNRVRHHLGVFSNRLEEYEAARDYLHGALAVAQQTESVEDEFYCHLNLINSFVGLGDYEAATNEYLQGLALGEKTGNVYQVVAIRTSYIEVLLKQGNMNAVAGQIDYITAAIENEQFPDVLVPAAGVAMGLAYRQNRLQSAAALLGGFAAWQERITAHVDDTVEGYVEAIHAEIPDDPESELRRAYETGKSWEYEELRLATSRAARRYRRHSVHLDPAPAAVEFARKPAYALTSREYEVLSLLTSGKSNTDIAREMFISHRTISTHVSNILSKLQVSNRAAAVALAINEGLIAP